MRKRLLWVLFGFLTCGSISRAAAARTIEFTTTEVTEADVSVSHDGQRLIFTMLGHLFRLPVTGGTAEQLTFGPYYDTDPVFSPDGTRVAFVSDRDGTEGNVFVLELATRQITQATHEPWAGQPTWSPDGQTIVYLRFLPEAAPRWQWLRPAQVRRISLRGGEPESLSSPARLFSSVFYLPDGRLAWAIVERDQPSRPATTRIEVVTPGASVSVLRTFEGEAQRVLASPTGDGLYCRRIPPPWDREMEELVFVPLPDGAERLVASLPPHEAPRFAVGADKNSLYLGEGGRLWKLSLPSGGRAPIGFHARVRLEIQEPIAPPKAALAEKHLPLVGTVLSPRLSPDGSSLVYIAAGSIWQQPLKGGQARRLFQGSAFESDPAFSPDGRQLAFVHSENGKEEIRVFDFDNRRTRSVASGTRQPSWSSDGRKLVFMAFKRGAGEGGFRVVVVNLSDGKEEQLADTGEWSPRPHFSLDGQLIYYSANATGTATLYRLPLDKKDAKLEPVTRLDRHLSDGLVSPDGKWLAFRRNREIWVAPLGSEPVSEKDLRRLSPVGGDTFAFTPDGSAVIYAVGNRVWVHPLVGGEVREVPIRMELQRPTPPPVLLRRVRVLDFRTRSFSRETSLFIDQGRIGWIGSDRGRKLPRETVTLDTGGRFAIPGLFDMHVHVDRWWHSVGEDQHVFLAYGVTSVREPGGEPGWTKALSDRSEATNDPVPRYFFAGEYFEGTHSLSGDLSLLIDNEEDARTYVRRLKESGVHFLKIYASLSWQLKRAVAEEARRQGLPVVGHGMSVEEITKSVTLGYASLEHGPWGGRFYDDVLQMLAVAGTRWDPTLGISGGNSFLLHDDPERLADAKLRAFAPASDIQEGSRCPTHNALRGVWVEELRGVRAGDRRGVKLLAGTDASHPCVYYGSSLHWELEHLVQAGVGPLEVLRIATLEAAEALGAQDDLGTLEPGKLADIVLLDRNPLEDIKNTQTVWQVIKGGWVFDPEKIRPPASIGPP